MRDLTETRLVGVDAVRAVSALLDRIRLAHATAGLFEAGEVQWWWAQTERATDEIEQLVWTDVAGRPVAAIPLTAFGSGAQLDPMSLPNATPDWRRHVVDRGLAHAARHGIEHVMLEVGRDDVDLRAALGERGFAIQEAGVVESWLEPTDGGGISPLADGYELADRAIARDRPHAMRNERRGHVDPTPRLVEMPLYRADLDLAVYGPAGDVAGYALCWMNENTGVGVIEPVRTEDAHQGRGIARHLVTTGVHRLFRAGSSRVKICFEPSNAASWHLYRSIGFVPDRENDLFVGPTGG